MSEDATLDEFLDDRDKRQHGNEQRIRGDTVPTDWKIVTVDDISERMGDGGTPSRQGNEDYFGGDITWVVVDDVEFEIEDSKEKLTKKGLDNSSATLWPEGSIIVTTGASIGEVGIAKQPTATKQGITGIIPTDKINSHFLARYLEANEATLNRFAQGTTFEEIRPYVLKGVEMPLPALSEQRKIATVLYTVDRAIEKTEETVEQIDIVQEGLLRSLFGKEKQRLTPDVETKTERLGPKQFQVPVTWDTTEISSIGKIVTGDTPSTDDESNFGGTLPFVTPATLSQGKYVTESSRTLSEAGRNEAKPIPKGSVMMDCIGSDMGKVAVSGCEVATNQQINSVVFEEASYLPEFLYYHLQVLSDFIKSQAGQTATPIVNKSSFESFTIFNPPLEEQREIVDTLSIYDEGRRSNVESLAGLKRLKRGLMQDLLSGTVRTTDTNVEVPEEIAQYG